MVYYSKRNLDYKQIPGKEQYLSARQGVQESRGIFKENEIMG